MKQVKTFMNCAGERIKNFFFKSEKNDISHACEEMKNRANNRALDEEEKHNEEYTVNYVVTTRWQTI